MKYKEKDIRGQKECGTKEWNRWEIVNVMLWLKMNHIEFNADGRAARMSAKKPTAYLMLCPDSHVKTKTKEYEREKESTK